MVFKTDFHFFSVAQGSLCAAQCKFRNLFYDLASDW